ncbi:MAG: hypothetical protein JSR80_00955 [Verrucomicrobia bacterium]|nr:hypothetical protein [Verrucomicrobiota bacterium]
MEGNGTNSDSSSCEIVLRRSVAAGAAMCALGYLAYAGMLSLAKFASTTLAVTEILFFQNLVCLLLTFPVVLQRGVSGFRTSYPLIHLLRDAAGIASYLLLYFALQHIPIVDGTQTSLDPRCPSNPSQRFSAFFRG